MTLSLLRRKPVCTADNYLKLIMKLQLHDHSHLDI
jgi:hypothetical protein